MGHGENMGALDTQLMALANEIRSKTGVAGALSLDAMADAITNCPDFGKISDISFLQRDVRHLAIPSGVKKIGNFAFYGCSSLVLVTIPSSVTSIGEYAFGFCSSLISATVSNVKTIGKHAFYKCSSLASITIPNGVTTIEYSTFNGCSALTSVTIPNSITKIAGHAFGDCSSLTSVTIPSSVTSIEATAFADCLNLTDIYCGFAEGAVSGAPWGASNATIHYNS